MILPTQVPFLGSVTSYIAKKEHFRQAKEITYSVLVKDMRPNLARHPPIRRSLARHVIVWSYKPVTWSDGLSIKICNVPFQSTDFRELYLIYSKYLNKKT